MENLLEKIHLQIFDEVNKASDFVANQIADLIKENNKKGAKTVLGLATGNTPLRLYSTLIRLHKEENLSFKNVITFNLDEYIGIDPTHPGSYHYYMHENFFRHIDIDTKNCFLPSIKSKDPLDIKRECEEYECRIDEFGGIDIQILGVGENGHIGFNEPGSGLQTKTRLVHLNYSTRAVNSFAFNYDVAKVPSGAMSMGVDTILKAKKIFLLAFGERKAHVVKQSVEGNVSDANPSSFLQYHQDCVFILDNLAASQLSRIEEPWMTGSHNWTTKSIKRAVTKMALKLKKPILELTEKDYKENGLADLLAQSQKQAYYVNLDVFYLYRDSITGWPGGKPKQVDTRHPERSEPHPKRVVIFSPHPDDDIISMGGTFIRLQEQGHDVHVAYQTSGNIAVNDEFVERFLDFVIGFGKEFNLKSEDETKVFEEIHKELQDKKNTKTKSIEPLTLRKIKGLIRRCEARAVCRMVGVPNENIHFMNLPFYETGTIKKGDVSEKDVNLTIDLLNKVQPHQVYCAGDLADPHGTHKVCLDVVLESLKICKEKKESWIPDCWLWLYKGAWQEWNPWEIEMAIPMSPDQILQKRNAIFVHQSQKDAVPFMGEDSREFWQRTEARNKETADIYAHLGLTKYAALEAFVKYDY